MNASAQPDWIPIVITLERAGADLIKLAGQIIAGAGRFGLAADAVPAEHYRTDAREKVKRAIEALAQLERLAAGKQLVNLPELMEDI